MKVNTCFTHGMRIAAGVQFSEGYTEDKDKLDLGNTMHGDEEEVPRPGLAYSKIP